MSERDGFIKNNLQFVTSKLEDALQQDVNTVAAIITRKQIEDIIYVLEKFPLDDPRGMRLVYLKLTLQELYKDAWGNE